MEEGTAALYEASAVICPLVVQKTYCWENELGGAAVISDNIHSRFNLSWHRLLRGREGVCAIVCAIRTDVVVCLIQALGLVLPFLLCCV